MITLITGLINEELSDVSLYTSEAALFKKKVVAGDSVAERFHEFAAQEALHAEALSALIGKPPVSAPSRGISTSRSLRTTLEMHIKREDTGIKVYRELAARLKDPAHRAIVDAIIAQELEHLRRAGEYLSHLRRLRGECAS